MKINSIIIGLFSLITAAKGQNLVSNGDLEQYSGCPDNYSELDSAVSWINPTLNASPDYYNACSATNVNVPNAAPGYQQAFNGVAYAGCYLWLAGNFNYRENIEAPLISPLIAGTCYHFEMYISLAEISGYTTADIGVYFSDTLVTGINNSLPLPFVPQISNLTFNVFDTAAWTLVSGNYIAAGGESYILIGNFKDDQNTGVTQFNSPGFDFVYVYIDGVSLSSCTGIENHHFNETLKIYPSPAQDKLLIECGQLKLKQVKIYDMEGRIQVQQNNFDSHEFNIKFLKPGIYFIEINDGKYFLNEKFIKY
ncbi:MAG: T9SS type A sorting domain-containing protein [Bacteroidota bacterium]